MIRELTRVTLNAIARRRTGPSHRHAAHVGDNVAQARRQTIGIMGPWVGNLGDAAIQQTMLQHIRRYFPEAEICGFAQLPRETEKRHGIRSYPIGNTTATGWRESAAPDGAGGLYLKLLNRMRSSSSPALRYVARWLARGPVELALIAQAFRHVAGLRYLIVSGGGQLDDYWGGAWNHPYTLLKFGLLARLRGARLLVVSVGAGPINAPLSKLFIRCALSLASYRSYRDQASKELLRRIGYHNPADPIYPDLAHSLDIEPYLAARPPAFGERTLVGIGPMSYFDPRVWPERDQHVYHDYLTKLANLVCWLLEQDCDTLLFTGEVRVDREVIADLRDLLAARGIERDDPRVIEPAIESVDDLMTQLARVDLAIASRFHGVLLPQLLNKPVLALSYHPKIDNLMADMGQAAYCLPIDSFDLEEAKARFVAMRADQAAIKTTMAERTRAYREALDEQYRQIFGSG